MRHRMSGLSPMLRTGLPERRHELAAGQMSVCVTIVNDYCHDDDSGISNAPSNEVSGVPPIAACPVRDARAGVQRRSRPSDDR
jgi:hypothetical protein